MDNPLPSSIAPLQNPVDFLQQPHSKHTLAICDNLDDEEEEVKDFLTVSLEDDHWTAEEMPDRHLCIQEHSVPHGCVHTPAHICIIYLHCTMTPWILVTFLSLKI